MNWTVVGGVGAGLVVLLIAILCWKKGDKAAPRATAFAILFGSALINGSLVATWMQRGVNHANNWAAAGIGYLTGQAAGWLVFLALLLVFAFDIWKKRVGVWTLVIAAVMPYSITLIPGVVGRVGSGLIQGGSGVIGSGVAALFGGF